MCYHNSETDNVPFILRNTIRDLVQYESIMYLFQQGPLHMLTFLVINRKFYCSLDHEICLDFKQVYFRCGHGFGKHVGVGKQTMLDRSAQRYAHAKIRSLD